MAAQKSVHRDVSAPACSRLEAEMPRRWVRARCNISGVICELAEIIRISHGRLTGARIIDLQPGADPVFVPNIIIAVEEIGWSIHAADYLDLIHRHTKSVVKII